MMGSQLITFAHPWALLLCSFIPLILLWFLFKQRQFWHDAFAFSRVSFLEHIKQNKRSVLHQRIMPLLLLIALAFGIVGIANPTIETTIASRHNNLMLVMDVSISMEANDIAPNRLDAAKKSAIEFVNNLPEKVRLGLVLFSGNSQMVSSPTEDHAIIANRLQRLTLDDLRPGTAIGNALLLALDGLHQTHYQHNPDQSADTTKTYDGSIILMTDGENNIGISPSIAIEEALRNNIQVFTVGIGEATGAYIRGGIFTHLDESTLQLIAQQTGGTYYRARSFKDFQDVYHKISDQALHMEKKTVSLMPIFLILSTIFSFLGLSWGIHYRRF